MSIRVFPRRRGAIITACLFSALFVRVAWSPQNEAPHVRRLVPASRIQVPSSSSTQPSADADAGPSTIDAGDKAAATPLPPRRFTTIADLPQEWPVGSGQARRCPPVPALCHLNDVFDAIFLLSLPRLADRFERVVAQLEELAVNFTLIQCFDAHSPGVNSLHTLVRVQPAPAPGVSALFMTHLALLEYVARAPAYTRVLLLEDDTIFHADFPRAFDAHIRRVPLNWRALWLGTLMFRDTLGPHREQWRRDGYAVVAHSETYCSFAIGFDARVARAMLGVMVSTRTVIDHSAYHTIKREWPSQFFLMWPPLISAPPYHASTLRKAFFTDPGHVWADINGIDTRAFDLERGFHVGGERGSDLTCVPLRIDSDGPISGVFAIVNASNAASCCAECTSDWPKCRSSSFDDSTHKCHLGMSAGGSCGVGRVCSVPVQVDADWGDPLSVTSAAMLAPLPPQAPPTLPVAVHLSVGAAFDVWAYLTTLSALVTLEADAVYVHHDAGTALEGTLWECVRSFVHEEEVGEEWEDTGGPPLEGGGGGGHHHAFKGGPPLDALYARGGIYLRSGLLPIRNLTDLLLAGGGGEGDAISILSTGGSVRGSELIVTPPHAPSLRAWRSGSCDGSGGCLMREGSVHVLPHECVLVDSVDASGTCSDLTLGTAYALWDTSITAPSFRRTEDALKSVWRGGGTYHRAARALLRKASRISLLCPTVSKTYKRLAAAGAPNGTCTDGNHFIARLQQEQEGALEDPTLPDGWQAMKSQRSGKVFYYHVDSGDSTYDRPASVK